MTKRGRAARIAQGLLMLAYAMFLAVLGSDALGGVLWTIGLGMSLRGIRTLIYYFTMARYMVGGKFVLYRGIIFLDAGIYTSAVADHPAFTLVLYIAAINAFAGLVDILRAAESKRLGSSHWKLRAAQGAVQVGIAAAVLAGSIVLRRTDLAVYAYASGLIVAACLKIASAFRRTAIAYFP